MRVALVNVTTTTKIGGVETFVWQLARILAAKGISATIFGGATAGGPSRPALTDVAVVTAPYLDRAHLRSVPVLSRQYGLTKLLERLSFGVTAQAALRAGAFDIVHIHKPFDFPLASYLRARTNSRIVYSSHGRDFFPGDRRLINAVDRVTACSRYNAAEVRERFGREACVVYNGVDIDLFAPRPPDVAWEERIAAPGTPVALWAGRLERWKGTIDAVRAIALARHPVHLVIAGRGPEAGRLRAAAQSLGIADRVHMVGARPHEELPGMFAASDVVLGTSFANETFGMTLAEASACARPVIATDFGGFPEVVRQNETGILVPPRAPAALAAAIDTLLDDPQRACRMGEAGRAWVASQFAWPIVADRVIAVYREALGAH
jgi:D-inositol-3-phosphate glycosyltransferase